MSKSILLSLYLLSVMLPTKCSHFTVNGSCLTYTTVGVIRCFYKIVYTIFPMKFHADPRTTYSLGTHWEQWKHTITRSRSDNFAKFTNGSDAIRVTGANGCEMIPVTIVKDKLNNSSRIFTIDRESSNWPVGDEFTTGGHFVNISRASSQNRRTKHRFTAYERYTIYIVKNGNVLI